MQLQTQALHCAMTFIVLSTAIHPLLMRMQATSTAHMHVCIITTMCTKPLQSRIDVRGSWNEEITQLRM